MLRACGHCNVIFASFTTFAHIFTSASISARCSPEVLDTGSTPDATSFARTSGYKPDYSALTMDAEVVFPWDRKIFEDGEWVVNPRYREVVE